MDHLDKQLEVLDTKIDRQDVELKKKELEKIIIDKYNEAKRKNL